jgi:hypothetical protein
MGDLAHQVAILGRQYHRNRRTDDGDGFVAGRFGIKQGTSSLKIVSRTYGMAFFTRHSMVFRFI